jgi:hypothetical protein
MHTPFDEWIAYSSKNTLIKKDLNSKARDIKTLKTSHK